MSIHCPEENRPKQWQGSHQPWESWPIYDRLKLMSFAAEEVIQLYHTYRLEILEVIEQVKHFKNIKMSTTNWIYGGGQSTVGWSRLVFFAGSHIYMPNLGYTATTI